MTGSARIVILFFILPILLCRANELANDSRLRLTFGLSHRFYDDVSFVGQEFRGLGDALVGTAASGPGASAASRAAALSNGPYGVQAVGSPLAAPETTISAVMQGADETFGIAVALDYIRFDGSSVGGSSESGTGGFIGLERDLYGRGAWTVGLLGSLQYHHLGISHHNRGDMFASSNAFTAEQYSHTLVDVDGNPFDAVITGVINPATVANAIPAPDTSTVFLVRNALSMDLFTLDLGGIAIHHWERGALRLAAGPTVNVASVATSQRLRASWSDIGSSFPDPPLTSAPVTVNAGTVADRFADSAVDVSIGGYASLGLAYVLSETVTAGVDVRYDFVDRHVGTQLSDVDLDGYSLRLTMSYRF